MQFSPDTSVCDLSVSLAVAYFLPSKNGGPEHPCKPCSWCGATGILSLGLVLLIFLFLNTIKIEFGAFWLLLMALLAFPRASERCQQYILLSSRLSCVSRSPYPTPHGVEFQGTRHCPRTALFPSFFPYRSSLKFLELSTPSCWKVRELGSVVTGILPPVGSF